MHACKTAWYIEQALLRLKPAGRLVAVVGRGMALDRIGFREWWSKIEERYHVRANIGMDGKCYGKFGTSFDNQIIVIDNNGPTPNEADVITGSGLSPHEACQRIAPLAGEDVSARSHRQQGRATRIRLLR